MRGAMRITKKDLELAVLRLNEYLDLPAEPYSKGEDGKLHPNAGVYCLGGAYGGWTLERMSMREGCTGVTTPLSCGYVPKRELYYLIQAYRSGLRVGRGDQV